MVSMQKGNSGTVGKASLLDYSSLGARSKKDNAKLAEQQKLMQSGTRYLLAVSPDVRKIC